MNSETKEIILNFGQNNVDSGNNNLVGIEKIHNGWSCSIDILYDNSTDPYTKKRKLSYDNQYNVGTFTDIYQAIISRDIEVFRLYGKFMYTWNSSDLKSSKVMKSTGIHAKYEKLLNNQYNIRFFEPQHKLNEAVSEKELHMELELQPHLWITIDYLDMNDLPGIQKQVSSNEEHGVLKDASGPIYLNGYIPQGRIDNNTTRISASAGAWMGSVTTSYTPSANFIYELSIPCEYTKFQLSYTPHFIPYSTLNMDPHTGHMLGCVMVKEVLSAKDSPNILTNVIYPGDIILRVNSTNLVDFHTSSGSFDVSFSKYVDIIEKEESTNSARVWKILRLASASYNNINKISPVEIFAYLNNPQEQSNSPLKSHVHFNTSHVSAKLRIGFVESEASNGFLETSGNATGLQPPQISTAESVLLPASNPTLPVTNNSANTDVSDTKQTPLFNDSRVFKVFLEYLHPNCPLCTKHMMRTPSIIGKSPSHPHNDQKKSRLIWKNCFDHTQSVITAISKAEKNNSDMNHEAWEEEEEWQKLSELNIACGGGVYLESRQKSGYQHPHTGYKTRYVSLLEAPTVGCGVFFYVGVYSSKVEALYAYRVAVEEYLSTGRYRLKGGTSMIQRMVAEPVSTTTPTPASVNANIQIPLSVNNTSVPSNSAGAAKVGNVPMTVIHSQSVNQ